MRIVLGLVLVFGAYAYAQIMGFVDLARAVPFGAAVLGGCIIAVEIVLGLRGRE